MFYPGQADFEKALLSSEYVQACYENSPQRPLFVFLMKITLGAA